MILLLDLSLNDHDLFDRHQLALIHYWPINGNLNDVAGGKHLINGENCQLSRDRFGRPNSAISLNHGYYKLPPGTYFDGEFTFSLWFNIRSMAGIPNILEVSNYNGNLNDRVTFYFYNSIIHYAFDVATSLKVTCGAPDYKNELNKWTHATFVFSSQRNQIYINGVQQRTVCTDGSWRRINGVIKDFPPSVIRSSNYFGRTSYMFRYRERVDFNGELDEIRIYNYAISDEKIRADFNHNK